MNTSKSYWRDKVALITGGSSGIGLSIARLLAQEGAQVWLLARRPDCLEAALAEIRSNRGVCCGAVPADVSDPEQVNSAIDLVIREAGIPDIVVNSAGITQPGYFMDLDLEVFQRMMAVNYFGTVYVTKAVLPGMLKRGSGHIINIASLAAQISFIGYSAYAPSKAAVRAFSDALRTEVKRHGVRLSIVLPTDTDTPQLAYEKQFKPPECDALASMSGVMSPDYVARVTLQEAAKGRYIIVPGLESKFWHRIYELVGGLAYPVEDWLIRRSQQKRK